MKTIAARPTALKCALSWKAVKSFRPCAIRILGRVTAEDVYDMQHNVVVPRGTLIDENICDKIDAEGIDVVKVRTPLTCETRYGLCAKCYGRDLGRGTLVNAGEAVGVIAAQSIG